MLILSLSGASLLEKNNLRRTLKYVDATEKIHAGVDANQKIYFHRPYLALAPLCFGCIVNRFLKLKKLDNVMANCFL